MIGVTKAYCTRVGEGPFPTELHDAVGEALRKKGNDLARSRTPRRYGWLDLPLLRYADMINGIAWLVVTSLDVLDEQAESQSASLTASDGKEDAPRFRRMPLDTTPSSRSTRGLPGWQSATHRRHSEL